MRIETGALQINEDWTGLFIRGDEVFRLRDILAAAYRSETLDDVNKDMVLRYVALIDCDVNHCSDDREVQKIETLEEPT